ncbi:MAG: glycosyltransferase [Cyclobacteriaceae bacterium]|nr:glycosyltransferase [Cyclobacteriaceae bacterium]
MSSLVSVICLCYNHAKYVVEALNSVLAQTYPHIEIIIVDDFSTDTSREVITEFIKTHPDIHFIQNPYNYGNCKAFNLGLEHCKGEFIIDFAADDLMHPEKIEKQVKAFSESGPETGVVHHDARIVDESGTPVYLHSVMVHKILKRSIPNGIIFKDLLKYYFVNSPSMMIRKQVFEELNGYDETLSYEDFDFWIRSARKWEYQYLPEVLMTIRKLPNSMSARVSGWRKRHAKSTLIVCEKALGMGLNLDEKRALRFRLMYEIKQSIMGLNFNHTLHLLKILLKTLQ